jgi:hypothetical protein
MWDVAIVGMLAILYSSLNSFNALRHSISQDARTAYVSFLFSFLPVLVSVYAIAVWQYAPVKISTFQIIALMFGGLAALLDFGLFTWLTFGNMRGGFDKRRAA